MWLIVSTNGRMKTIWSISTDAEKNLWYNSKWFMTKTLQKVGIERAYLNIMKVMYDRPTCNILWEIVCMCVCVCVCVLSHFSCVWLCVTLWTVACQAPLSMRFSRQEYWSGLPCPSPRDLPNPGIKRTSLRSPALAGGFFTKSAIWEAHCDILLRAKKLFL